MKRLFSQKRTLTVSRVEVGSELNSAAKSREADLDQPNDSPDHQLNNATSSSINKSSEEDEFIINDDDEDSDAEFSLEDSR